MKFRILTACLLSLILATASQTNASLVLGAEPENEIVDNQLSVMTMEGSTTQYLYVAPTETVSLYVQVSAVDMEGITYQWKCYDASTGVTTEIEGADTERIVTKPIVNYMRYECAVSDAYGNSGTVMYYIYVQNQFNAVSSDGEINKYVGSGDSVECKVVVTGKDTSRVSYQWYLDDVLMEGEVSERFTLDDVQDYHRVRCRASDGYGSVSYVTFYVSVENHLSISAQNGASSFSVAPGGHADLTVSVEADDLTGITYTWYKSYSRIENESGNTLSLTDLRETASYHCSVTDRFGNTKSQYFDISVNHFEAKAAEGYFSVHAGEPCRLEVQVTADDMGGVTYNWSLWGATIEEAEGAVYNIESVTRKGTYSCEVSDAYGNRAYISFTIDVNHFQMLLPSENVIEINAGESCVLEALISSDDMDGITYRWSDSSGVITETQTATLETGPLMKSTTYSCQVSDQYWNSAYYRFNVAVNHLTVTAEDGSTKNEVVIGAGEDVTLKVVISADDLENLTISWSGAGGNSPADSPDTFVLSGLTSGTDVSCTVTDNYGNRKVVSFAIRVNHFSVLTENGTKEMSVYEKEGVSVTLKPIVNGDDLSNLSYRWSNPEGYCGTGSEYSIEPFMSEWSLNCRVTDSVGDGDSVLYRIYAVNDDVKIFMNNGMQADICLPEEVRVVHEEAFAGLQVETVKCSENLERIEALAFRDCENLKIIYIPASTSFIADDAFSGCPSGLVIVGSSNSLANTYARRKGFSFVPFWN